MSLIDINSYALSKSMKMSEQDSQIYHSVERGTPYLQHDINISSPTQFAYIDAFSSYITRSEVYG